jgi:hypothetical protein
MTARQAQSFAKHDATPSAIDATMFAVRRPGGNSPTGPRQKGEAKPPAATGGSYPLEARVAAAAVKLERADEAAGVDALLRLVGAETAPRKSAAEPPDERAPRSAEGKRVRRRTATWHEEARRLRAAPHCLTIKALAERFGRTEGAVYCALRRGADR